MLRSDEFVRSEMLVRHPEYQPQIRSGRRLYIEWMFRRELDDGNWSACFGLLRRLVLEGDTRLISARRAGICALRVAARIFRIKSPSLLSGPPYLPIENLTTLEDSLSVNS
jgi:hypothetical protein